MIHRPGSSHPEVLSILEADTYGFWADFSRRPGGESGIDGSGLWWRSGVPFITYNGIAGVPDDIDAALARVSAWGVPARWTLSSASTPETYESELSARGLKLYDEWPGMVARIEDLSAPELRRATVEEVRDAAASEEWNDVVCDGFGVSAEMGACVREAHAWPHMHQAGLLYLLVRLAGEPVATGLLRSAAGVAGIYGIAVRRAFQRRGLGTLATLLTVQEGARRGASIAVLQATQEGFPVYERLGFQTITSFRSWR
jgi:ribosomal protein S18 acetylase RimI-like enzyme